MKPRIERVAIRLTWPGVAVLFLLHVGLLAWQRLAWGEAWPTMAANTALLSLPLAIVYVCVGLLLTVFAQQRAIGAMSHLVRRLVFWIPRLAGLLFALFIGVFALDVFNAGYGVWQTMAALVIHLLPALLILAIVAIAWRWEWVGALALAALAVWMLTQFAEQWGSDWTFYTVFIAPLVLVAALFAVNWRYHDQLHPRQPAVEATG